MADQLTPEEKLLHVIQRGSAAPAVIGATPPGAERGDDGEGDSIHEVQPGHEHFTGAGIFLRALVLLALLLVAGVGYEIRCALPDPPMDSRVQEVPDPGEEAVQLFPPYSLVLANYTDGGIFTIPEGGPQPGPGDQVPPWALYVRQNFNWLGLSPVTDAASSKVVLEAIVMDRKTGKLQLLRQGQRLFISAADRGGETQEVTLGTVAADELMFTAGGYEMRLKKQ